MLHLALTFWSQPQVVADSWIELLTLTGIITILGGVYRHVECNKDGCHRLGRFHHGHLKLCHIHHPKVPSSGKITQEHIDQA